MYRAFERRSAGGVGRGPRRMIPRAVAVARVSGLTDSDSDSFAPHVA